MATGMSDASVLRATLAELQISGDVEVDGARLVLTFNEFAGDDLIYALAELARDRREAMRQFQNMVEAARTSQEV